MSNDHDITAERAIEEGAAQLVQAHVDQLDNDSAPPPILTALIPHASAAHDTPQGLPAFKPEVVKARNFHPVSDPKSLINMPTSLERDAIAAVPASTHRAGQVYNDLSSSALDPRANADTHPKGAPLSPSIPQTERFIVTMDEIEESPSGVQSIRTWAFRTAHDTTAYAMIVSIFLDRTWTSHGYALLQRAQGLTRVPSTPERLLAGRHAYELFAEAPNALHDIHFAVFDMGDKDYDSPLSQTHLVTVFCSKDSKGNRSTIMHFSAPNAVPYIQPDGALAWRPEPNLAKQRIHPAAFGTDVAKAYVADVQARIDNALAAHGYDMGRLPILRHLRAEPIKRAVDRVHGQADYVEQLNAERHIDLVTGLRDVASAQRDTTNTLPDVFAKGLQDAFAGIIADRQDGDHDPDSTPPKKATIQ